MATTSTRHFPRVPTAEQIDPNDLIASMDAKDQALRDRMIRIEQAKLVRRQLRECYFVERANHHHKCKDLVDKFRELTKDL